MPSKRMIELAREESRELSLKTRISSVAWKGLECLAKEHGLRCALEVVEAIGDGRLKVCVDEEATRTKLAEYEVHVLTKARDELNTLISFSQKFIH